MFLHLISLGQNYNSAVCYQSYCWQIKIIIIAVNQNKFQSIMKILAKAMKYILKKYWNGP